MCLEFVYFLVPRFALLVEGRWIHRFKFLDLVSTLFLIHFIRPLLLHISCSHSGDLPALMVYVVTILSGDPLTRHKFGVTSLR